jgi:tetratricopeptide (TPR) repeat protein
MTRSSGSIRISITSTSTAAPPGAPRATRTGPSRFNQAIRLDPKDADAYYGRGKVWEAKDDLDRAITDYSEAIRLNPKSGHAYVNRGGAWGAKGDLDRAIADFDQAIRLDPKDAQAYYNRGIAREMQRRLRAALADFKMHAQLAPSNPDGVKAMKRVAKELSTR